MGRLLVIMLLIISVMMALIIWVQSRVDVASMSEEYVVGYHGVVRHGYKEAIIAINSMHYYYAKRYQDNPDSERFDEMKDAWEKAYGYYNIMLPFYRASVLRQLRGNEHVSTFLALGKNEEDGDHYMALQNMLSQTPPDIEQLVDMAKRIEASLGQLKKDWPNVSSNNHHLDGALLPSLLDGLAIYCKTELMEFEEGVDANTQRFLVKQRLLGISYLIYGEYFHYYGEGIYQLLWSEGQEDMVERVVDAMDVAIDVVETASPELWQKETQKALHELGARFGEVFVYLDTHNYAQ